MRSHFLSIPLIIFSAIFLSRGCTQAATREIGNRQADQSPADKLTDYGYKHIVMPPLPNLPAKDWFNVSPDSGLNLKGKVVLIDFWDYTCVNCIRTLPYIEEWYKRYRKDGLVIIGVHSPEFSFARKRANVARAIEKFGITYPVVLDNKYEIWDRFGNQYWPSKYLFDKNGILRYLHFGEGNYGNFEASIQKLLKEINPDVALPPLMAPIRPTDAPGAVCYRTTPETYLGYERGRIGNKMGYKKDTSATYTLPYKMEKDRFYLQGKWDATLQYVKYAGTAGAGKILIDYIAAQANLVLNPDIQGALAAGTANSTSTDRGGRLYVYQDGKPVPPENRGRDIKVGKDGRTYVEVTQPRMYYLINNKEYGRHILALEPSSDSFAAYAFTFGTACEEPGMSK